MKINVWKASTLALAAALTLVVGQGFVGEAGAEAQPHMKSALASLTSAKGQLQKATHDKGGHRAKAVQLTDEAIEQVKKGIAADNAH
jgi:hypothetical protein